VALALEEQVLVLDPPGGERGHDLFGLLDRHVGVVAPWTTSSGATSRSIRWIGDRARSRSASRTGSPYSATAAAAIHDSVCA
jgi:hypothetical protein